MFEKLVALARTNALAASLILGTILVLGISSTYLLPEFNNQDKIDQSINKNIKQNQESTTLPTQVPSIPPHKELTVDIQGAVHNPGVYTLPSTARISDALNAAGDISLQADTIWIARNLNRATKLNDGDKLYIPKKGEIKEPMTLIQKPTIPTTTNAPVTAVLGLTSQAASQATASQSTSTNPSTEHDSPTSNPSKEKISINTSSQSELDSLNGIGEKRAQDIIKGRPYTKLEDLYEKKIIYKSVYEKIKNDIEL